uniref:Uncharacterized protein n=1 Tax=Arcella intermedia TaxID=1963864 RepID=A0A6B2L2K3_9EUKA
MRDTLECNQPNNRLGGVERPRHPSRNYDTYRPGKPYRYYDRQEEDDFKRNAHRGQHGHHYDGRYQEKEVAKREIDTYSRKINEKVEGKREEEGQGWEKEVCKDSVDGHQNCNNESIASTMLFGMLYVINQLEKDRKEREEKEQKEKEQKEKEQKEKEQKEKEEKERKEKEEMQKKEKQRKERKVKEQKEMTETELKEKKEILKRIGFPGKKEAKKQETPSPVELSTRKCPNCMCGKTNCGTTKTLGDHRKSCTTFQQYFLYPHCPCGKSFKEDLIAQHKGKCSPHRTLLQTISSSVHDMSLSYEKSFKEFKQIFAEQSPKLAELLDFGSQRKCGLCRGTIVDGFKHFEVCPEREAVVRGFMMCLVNEHMKGKVKAGVGLPFGGIYEVVVGMCKGDGEERKMKGLILQVQERAELRKIIKEQMQKQKKVQKEVQEEESEDLDNI